jgi:hypothetical protein
MAIEELATTASDTVHSIACLLRPQMNTNRIPLLTFALSLMAMVPLGILAAPKANAHFPIVRHHWNHWHGGYGHYGYRHYGYRSFGYYAPSVSFYTYPLAYRSYSVGYYNWPLYYSTYSPVYCWPGYYYSSYSAPYITWPTSFHYQPMFFASSRSTSSQSAESGVGAHVAMRGLASQNAQESVPVMLRDRSQEPASPWARLVSAPSEMEPSHNFEKVVRLKPSATQTVQPYTPIWTKAAIGSVDDMVSEGRLSDAAASCRAMERVAQTKAGGVYLRQAITSVFAERSLNSVKTEHVLDLLNDACLVGSNLQGDELPRGTLTDYLSACDADVSNTLEQLSERCLASPETATQELVLLSVMLRLDGQAERASLFASEAMEAKNRNQRWNALIKVVATSSESL